VVPDKFVGPQVLLHFTLLAPRNWIFAPGFLEYVCTPGIESLFQDTFSAALARGSPHSWSCLFYLNFPFVFTTKYPELKWTEKFPSSHPCCSCQFSLFLVTFTKLQKSDYWLRHVRLSTWNNSAPTGQFAWNLVIWIFFENLSRKIQVSFKYDKNNGHFIWRLLYFWPYLVQST
jgi:hypothetical protein